MIDADRRARLAAAKAEITALMAPEREERKRKARADRKAMKERIGKREAGQRQERERDPGFLAFLRRQPCAASHMGDCSGPIEAAHVRYSDASRGVVNPGMQRKNHDRHCNPLCRSHHQHDQHQRREQDFWKAVGVNAYDNAAELHDKYITGS